MEITKVVCATETRQQRTLNETEMSRPSSNAWISEMCQMVAVGSFPSVVSGLDGPSICRTKCILVPLI